LQLKFTFYRKVQQHLNAPVCLTHALLAETFLRGYAHDAKARANITRNSQQYCPL